MKKNFNNKGFAMVETLIAAVSVISIFSLLYNLVYPLLGGYNASQNYDDLDSKYIAFYVKEMIETDLLNISNLLPENPEENLECNGLCNIYETYTYVSDENGERKVDISDLDVDENSGKTQPYHIGNELCDTLQTGNYIKSNRLICNQFIEAANIKRIFLTKYAVKSFKDYIKDSTLSRSLKKYVAYMPTHEAASLVKKNNYYRIIVEIEHDSYNTSKDTYYSYASIEVKK